MAFRLLAMDSSSVTDSKPLLTLLKVMSEIASDGPSLSYFGWTERRAELPANAVCTPTDRTEALHYLENLTDEMDWASENQKLQIKENREQALKDFSGVLARDLIVRCDWDISEQMTATNVTRFTNEDSGYQITFSLGYED
jgi:hypothetical protein